MISRENVQVFGVVSREIKRRIKNVRDHNPHLSESKIIQAGLLRILPELEEQPGPNHDGPRRRRTAA